MVLRFENATVPVVALSSALKMVRWLYWRGASLSKSSCRYNGVAAAAIAWPFGFVHDATTQHLTGIYIGITSLSPILTLPYYTLFKFNFIFVVST